MFVVLAVGYGAKLLRRTGSVKAEFMHPIAGHFFGTIAIAVLGGYDSALGNAIWVTGTVLTLLLALHCKRLAKSH